MTATARGFTLLELLVALAVFAVMAAAAYSGLNSVLGARAALAAEDERLKEVQMAFYFLQRDIELAVPRGVRDAFGQPQPAMRGGRLADPPLVLTHAGWDNPLGLARADLQRVAYRLDHKTLQRIYWNTLDLGKADLGQTTALTAGVRDFKVRFLDAQRIWQEQWPPLAQDAQTAGAVLPRAVEISLVLDDWGEIVRLFRLAGS
ncbi:MAG: type II secretion system minor pseudopilin GspJ [Gammaproteobacteria bacterium]